MKIKLFQDLNSNINALGNDAERYCVRKIFLSLGKVTNDRISPMDIIKFYTEEDWNYQAFKFDLLEEEEYELCSLIEKYLSILRLRLDLIHKGLFNESCIENLEHHKNDNWEKMEALRIELDNTDNNVFNED